MWKSNIALKYISKGLFDFDSGLSWVPQVSLTKCDVYVTSLCMHVLGLYASPWNSANWKILPQTGQVFLLARESWKAKK